LDKNIETNWIWTYALYFNLFGVVALMQSRFFKSHFYRAIAIGTRVKAPLVYLMDSSIKP
jgi:hypothetical protein